MFLHLPWDDMHAYYIIKSCSVLGYLVTIKGACAQHPCLLTHSIVLPGTVQRGRSETGNATDPPKPCNFKMHRPCSTCSGARCKPCTVVLHGSVSCSYLLSAETFPLCFDGGEGKHKRLCLLSHSLPPSPSRWRFSGLRCNKDAKYERRSSCTWSLFASAASVSAQNASVQMHSRCAGLGKRRFCNCTAKNAPQHLHDGPRLAGESS